MTRERRWMLLVENGYHVWFGRHTDPSPEMLRATEARLGELGFGGWLSVHERDYWSREGGVLMMFRPLAPSACSWDQAMRNFEM